MVPLAIVLAEILGAAIAGEIRLSIDPSGTVQSATGTPIGEQLETFNVAILFGAPYAALAAAVFAYAGLRFPRPWVFSLGGVLAGVLVYVIVGFEAVAIGQWWVSSIPADTNRAAALFTLILAPPGALAAQFAVSAARVPSTLRPRTVAAGFVAVGAMFGLLLGSLLASITAALTWAINCPENGYTNCFSLSSVVSSALLIGSIAGVGCGVLTGTIAWLSRRRSESWGGE